MALRHLVTARELERMGREDLELVRGELVPVMTLFSDPDTVRGPDVSFVSRKRQTTAKRRRGFIHGTPDLGLEIASADKPMTQLAAKAVEYIEAGTLLVWVVDPKRRKVRVHRPDQPVRTLSQTDTLDGADVLPGFTLPLSRLFAELEDQ